MRDWDLDDWHRELKRCKVRLRRAKHTDSIELQNHYKARIRECEDAIHVCRVDAFINKGQGYG